MYRIDQKKKTLIVNDLVTYSAKTKMRGELEFFISPGNAKKKDEDYSSKI